MVGRRPSVMSARVCLGFSTRNYAFPGGSFDGGSVSLSSVKQSFEDIGSQAELGNQFSKRRTGCRDRIVLDTLLLPPIFKASEW